MGFKRCYLEENPCDHAFKVCDPAAPEYSEKLKGGNTALRRSSRVPSPAHKFVPTLGSEPSPPKKSARGLEKKPTRR